MSCISTSVFAATARLSRASPDACAHKPLPLPQRPAAAGGRGPACSARILSVLPEPDGGEKFRNWHQLARSRLSLPLLGCSWQRVLPGCRCRSCPPHRMQGAGPHCLLQMPMWLEQIAPPYELERSEQAAFGPAGWLPPFSACMAAGLGRVCLVWHCLGRHSRSLGTHVPSTPCLPPLLASPQSATAPTTVTKAWTFASGCIFVAPQILCVPARGAPAPARCAGRQQR